MKVRLKYFASLRELVGSAEEETQVPADSSAGSLLELVKNLHSSLRDVEKIFVAVNGEYVELDATIEEGDVVALFPPVSGG